MLKQTLILTFAILTSCGQIEKPKKNPESKTEKQKLVIDENKTDNALAFINAYTENSNKLKEAVGTFEWVNSNNLSTKNFKDELKRILDEAYREDLELGLDADPIFDAQDNPDQGFEIDVFDDKTNFLIVKGKDWPEFKVTMKVAKVNGEWLVDGCGSINIPDNRRATR